MRAGERQKEILSLIQGRGYMSIDILAGQFSVTPQTIRRDINALCEQKLLMRQHGGASLPSSVANSRYATRHIEQAQEKQRIARAVAAWLPDAASLFIALGTTMEAVAAALVVRRGLKIVTNSPEVARILWPRTDFEIILTGGTVRRTNGGLVGPRALATVADFRCDYALIGTGAVEADGWLHDFDDGEVAILRAMLGHARHGLVAADASKFARTASQRVAPLGALAALVSDRAPPPAIAAAAVAAGTEIVLAP